jgi:hypothetical protein
MLVALFSCLQTQGLGIRNFSFDFFPHQPTGSHRAAGLRRDWRRFVRNRCEKTPGRKAVEFRRDVRLIGPAQGNTRRLGSDPFPALGVSPGVTGLSRQLVPVAKRRIPALANNSRR